MSNIIPPLLSNSPPPPPLPEEDEDDEFGDFTGVNDLSYGCDNLSLPPSPDHSPEKVSILNGLDINSNADKNNISQIDVGIEKDFQDKRKLDKNFSERSSPVETSCIEDAHKKELFFEHSIRDNIDLDIDLRPTEDKSEIYNKPLDYDENFKNEFSEKENKLDDNVDNFYETNQKVNHVVEVLTKNVENETNDFVVNSIYKEHINDSKYPVDKNHSLDSSKENNINGESSLNEKITVEGTIMHSEGSLAENLADRKDYSLNDLVLPVLKENSKGNKDSIEICGEVNVIPPLVNNYNSLQNNQCDTNKVKTDNLKSSQEDQTVIKSLTENKAEVTSNSQSEEIFTNDVFDDFTATAVTRSLSVGIENEYENIDEYGDFADVVIKETRQKEDNNKSDLNIINDDDFGDFSSHSIFTDGDVKNTTRECNDFDDEFGDFTSTLVTENSQWSNILSSSTQDDDEFGNFANFSEVAQEPVVLTLNERQAFEKAELILKEIFPYPDDVQQDFQHVDVEKNDVIFNELKDVTETPALLYHWSKSSSQNVLLKSLNIDARNILYGPSWNPSMPRFAANLGLAPLEPVRTEILTPTSKSSPSITVQSANVEIPTAQFDWNGSGLVNPLDYSQTMLLDLEQLVASLEIPTCNSSSNNSTSPTTELDEWNIWLQSVSNEHLESPSSSHTTQKPLELSIEPALILQPKPALQDDTKKEPSKTDLEQKIDLDDFEDFTSFQSPQIPQPANWPSLPLRETYISNDNITVNRSKEIPLDIEGWLQPTIVTPELPRKDLSSGEEELPDIQTPELCRKNVAVEDLEDDFDDFQMVLPEPKFANADDLAYSGVLEPTKSEKTTNLHKLSLESSEFYDLNLCKDKGKMDATIKEEPNKRSLELEIVEEKEKAPVNDEDEFTDFHSFAPGTQQVTPKTLTPILEPLKPIPVYATVQYPTTSTSQINWPDPGITDEEIKKFEMVFSQSQKPKPESFKKPEVKPIKEEKAPQVENVVDEDEWSDFVSVQKPSPVHKFQLNERERTSSPDLPLSVLNLGNIQPAKQPIPVITPHGLVQTKLSSHNSINMSPKTQLKSVPQNRSVYQPQIHPSIISSQFASQAYNFNNLANQSKSGLNTASRNTTNVVNQKSLDDDDWSDFVSSPLPPPTANGYQQTWQNNLPYQQTGWSNASPNIIMNPGHFVQSGSDVRNKKVPNFSVTSKKSTVPNISVPDLEFIAPKARTSSSRRK